MAEPTLPVPDPDPVEPAGPDPGALRRRVLLTAVVSLMLFFVLTYVVTQLGGGDLYVLAGVLVLYAVVVRPLMRPVRTASALRRRLAYQAFLDGREEQP